MKAKGCLLILAALVGFSLIITVVRFYGGKYIDRYRSPWAYSTTKPLLVGRWRGDFRDPDGIAKTLDLRIDLPETDDKRWKRAGRRSRRRRTNNRAFEGTATVISKRGREEYEVSGAVSRTDDHQFKLSFGRVADKPVTLPAFLVSHTDPTGNRWQADQLTMTIHFVYYKADGSSFSSTADPRYSRVARLTLIRL